MRHVVPIAVMTVALVASVGALPRPAHAAESDRAARNAGPLTLAQNTAGSNLFVLLQDIQRLQDQVRDLRGQIDALQYQIRQNEQGQRELYQNLDQRITALERGGAAAGSAPSATRGTVAAQANPAVESAYLAAFDELKKGRYDAAINALQAFLQQYPETAYSDNAWYWLGEARYVQRDLSGALTALQTVVNRYAASPKVGSALYRIAVIQEEQGQTTNARATLERILAEYPNSDSAGLARQRLQAMGG